MSVSLNPSNSLGFRRPLTQLVKRSLTITNHNSQPIAFKVKTTAPKLYCVRPNSGRVEPGESIDVSVMLQALREEPPLNAKCKDKFLIQSTIITPEKETMPLAEIWNVTDGADENSKVHQQKLRVTYLPAEGQTLEEVDENVLPLPRPSSIQDSKFETVRQRPTNGHTEQQPIPEFKIEPPPHEGPRPQTPPADTSHADISHETAQESAAEHVPPPHPAATAPVAISEETRAAAKSEPASAFVPSSDAAPVPLTQAAGYETALNAELMAKLETAQAEIDRLRATLATLSETAPSELRQRQRVSSDAASTADTDFATMIEESYHPQQQEGVPLQIVVIIALAVFITTYLFF